MTYTLRPAVRENTPLIIGLTGPTKSGKTFSALRVAVGIAGSAPIVMINTETNGHQYADTFKYLATEIRPPYRPTSYTEALKVVDRTNPGVVIIDSATHMHDGPGGVLDWHEEILDKMAGSDDNKRQRATFAAWVQPKKAEQDFIYQLLAMRCHVILCFRAKEKIRIQRGQEVKELGWQPIASDAISFETLFTVLLPPGSKGVPDLAGSAMRQPFDTMIPKDKPLDEELGRKLVEWARGGAPSTRTAGAPDPTPQRSGGLDPATAELRQKIADAMKEHGLAGQSDADKAKRAEVIQECFGAAWREVEKQSVQQLEAGLAKLKAKFEPAASTSTTAPSDPPATESNAGGEDEDLDVVADLQGKVARAIEASGLKAKAVIELSEKHCKTSNYHDADAAALRVLLAELEKLVPRQATL